MNTSIKVLLIEDVELDAYLIIDELKTGGFQVTSRRVETAATMRDALETESWDIVLADYRLPSFDGLRAIALLKSLKIDCPFVLVSGAIGEEAAVEALKAGAADFVPKDRLTRLVAVVRRELREAESRRARRDLEQQVGEQQLRLQSVLDHSPALIYLTDREGRLVLTNRMFDDRFGRGSDTLLGRDAASLFPAEAAEQRREHHRLAVQEDNPVSAEETYALEGGTRTFFVVSFPLHDANGETAGVGNIGTDITELKQTQAQLFQAQKMEALGQLAGGVAHDFNNVLTSMIMMIDLLRSDQEMLPPPLASGLQELRLSADRAARLTKQLLLFGRRQMLQTQNFDLNQLLNGSVGMLRRLIPENIEVVMKPAPQPIWINADPGMIEQVLTNLCLNAKDAMTGGGTLRVSVRRILAAELRDKTPPGNVQNYACITVVDTGCGMEDATLKRIFEPFFTTKPVGKGTGLGLATVFTIVNQHRGWIEVDSTVGRGTEFRVFLPATESGVVETPVIQSSTPRGGTESILLVEDDEAVRRVAGLTLRHFGYRLTEASCGAEALEICSGNGANYDLLLTDMVMPGNISGAKLATEVRKINPRIKVIIATGYNPEFTETNKDSDVVYLSKPFSTHTLITTVRNTLDGNPAISPAKNRLVK